MYFAPDNEKKVCEMATKPKKAKSSGKSRRAAMSGPLFQWSFGMRNLIVTLIGLLLLVIGYYLMAQGPHDSFLSLTAAPIVLMFSYLVVFPAAILIKSPKRDEKE